MQLGIFAKTFAGNSPETVLSAAARAGYENVQYNLACSGIGALPLTVSDEAAAQIRAASSAAGVEIAAISATYNMIHPDMGRRAAGRTGFSAIAGKARAIGSRLLTVCTGSCDAEDQWRHHPDNRSAAAWRAMMDEFALLVEIAERHDIIIGVEPELANVVDSAEAARQLIEEIGSDRLRVVLDPANLAEVCAPDERCRIVERAVELLAGDIAMAHAKDRNSNGSFATAGKGVIDFPHFLNCLQKSGFTGPLVTHGLAESEAPWVAEYLSSTLARGDA